MWIVKLAIERPYTFVVVSILLALTAMLTVSHMAIDIFPNIDIPVVSVIWTFTGLSPEEMEQRIISISERAMTMVTSDIEHMESVSLSGLGIIRVYLHEGADMGQAVALMSAINQMELIDMPPGITPPAVVAFSATDAPVMQLGVNSKVLTEAELYDYDLNFIRTRLATVGGASIPLPYGGKQRQVMVDLYPDRLLAKGVSANDVVNALALQNIILPAGLARFGKQEYPVRINGSPNKLQEFNDLPIKQQNGATIYIRDIGYAHDGYSIQTNIVRMNGKRATMLNVLRAGGASTLNVVQGIKATLPLLKPTLPKSLDIQIVNDQSQFVRGAITQVVNEAVTAAILTGLLMLALLGSWRSTLIVAISIPLSIMTSIIGLGICGQTLNMMTLGGLSLAVGMLVDDATVEVENIHRNLALKLPLKEAVLTSAAQVALPAFVSTVSICIVFIPVRLLTEPSRSLFVPLGMAVVFAMLASYFLSRTLVPVMSVYLLKSEEAPDTKAPEGMSIEEAARLQSQAPLAEISDEEVLEHHEGAGGSGSADSQNVHGRRSWLASIHHYIDRRFNVLRAHYHQHLEQALKRRPLTVLLFTGFYLISACLIPFIGQDFFPSVDAGQMRLHLICPVGMRVDSTEQYFSKVETAIRKMIPPGELVSSTENVGTPASGLSLCYGDNTNFTEFDGEMLLTLNQEHHGSTFAYQKRIRAMLDKDFPMLTYYFQPADITTQILNAGLQAPIDIQVTGLLNREENYRLAMAIKHDVALIPGAVDVLVRQVLRQPQINIDVDRTKAIQLGLSQHDVASSLLTSLSSSFQTSPSFWVNPDNGVNYTVAVQTPLYRIVSTDSIRKTLVTGTGANGLLTKPSPPNSNSSLAAAATATPSSGAALAAGMPTQVSTAAVAIPPAISGQVQPTIQAGSLMATLVVAPPPSTTTAAATPPTSSTSTSTTSASASSTSTGSATTTTTPSITQLTPTAQAAQNLSIPSTSSSSQTVPSTTAVQTLTTPSTANIADYLTTNPTADPTAAPTTIPLPAAPTTVLPSQSTPVQVLTTPSTLTSASTAAVSTYTTPSPLQIPSYLTTSASPTQVATPTSLIPLAVQTAAQVQAQTTTYPAPIATPTTTSISTAPSQTTALSTTPTAISTTGSAVASQTASSAPASNNLLSSQTTGLGVHTPTPAAPGVSSLLMNMSATRRSPTEAMVSHYAIQPVFDVYANTQDRDLGGVAQDVEKVVAKYKSKAPLGTLIYMRGQADSMGKAFRGLIVGIMFALILIYLLLVVNFQSWLDPLIILMAIPGALSGIVWALFLTQTPFSVPALMGAIMSIGVGSANSILMVNFANEQLHAGTSPPVATSRAGFIRFRPVLMTALAMMIGMVPMASGLGEGGGQNAPLGRAVIGGLIVATLSTLFFVPVIYSLMKTAKVKQGTNP